MSGFRNFNDFLENASADDFVELKKLFDRNESRYNIDADAKVFFKGFTVPLDDVKVALIQEGYIQAEQNNEPKAWTPPVEKTPISSEDLKDFRMSSDDDFGMDIEMDVEEIDDEEFADITGETDGLSEDADDHFLDDLDFDDDGEDVDPKDKKKGKKEEKETKKSKIETQFDEEEQPLAETPTIDETQPLQSLEDAVNETINNMEKGLDTLNQYDEHGSIIESPTRFDKGLSDDVDNFDKAWSGQGDAGDTSDFGAYFDNYLTHYGQGGANDDAFNELLSGMVVGSAFTGSGDQIREEVTPPIMPPESPTTEIHGVHETISGDGYGVDSGFHLDDRGNMKSEAQEYYESLKRENYGVGQDTRDIHAIIDNIAANNGTNAPNNPNNIHYEPPANTLMAGEDFNRVYMEHFADARAVEFTSNQVPEGVNTVDFSASGNGSILGYEHMGVVYITAAPVERTEGGVMMAVESPVIHFNQDSSSMFKDATNLRSVVFNESVADTSYVNNMSGMFLNCTELTTVNAGGLNTKSLENMNGIFANCNNLTDLNTHGWTTSAVVTASFAFSECNALRIDPSASFKMENLRYADGFMSGCTNLTNIDMSAWNAHNLVTTREMFNGCENAQMININGLQTAGVKDMTAMFKGCSNLEDVNLSKLNTSSLAPVINEASISEKIDGNVITTHPTQDIFYGCHKLVANENFKEQAMAWGASADRSVELNTPVYVNDRHFTDTTPIFVPVTTEIQNRDGSISSMTSFHGSNGTQMFIVPPVSAEAIAMQNGFTQTATFNNDGTISVTTSKVYGDNTQVSRVETFAQDGSSLKVETIAKDNFGVTVELSQARLSELNNVPTAVSTSKLNEDGTISVTTIRKFDDVSNVIKTDTVNQSGVVVNSNVIGYTNNGPMNNIPATKLEEIAKLAPAVVLSTADKNGNVVIQTSRTFADGSNAVQRETVSKDGSITRDISVHDSTGKRLADLPQNKLAELAVAKNIEINTSHKGTEVVLTMGGHNGNSTIVTSRMGDNNKPPVSNTVIHNRDGSTSTVNQPTFAGGFKYGPSGSGPHGPFNSGGGIGRGPGGSGNGNSPMGGNANNNSNGSRSSKVKPGGAIFGNKDSSTARTIYDSAKIKADNLKFYANKDKESINKAREPLFNMAKNLAQKAAQPKEPLSEQEKDVKEVTNKFKKISAGVTTGILGLSVASSLKFEKQELQKGIKAADTADRLKVTADALKGKSRTEVKSQLENLKDSNGRQLLSKKQINELAKHRGTASDMLLFKESFMAKSNAGLLNYTKDTKLTVTQEKAIEKFRSGDLAKLKPKDITNIVEAYTKTNKASALYGKDLTRMKKSDIEAIIKGKHPEIKIDSSEIPLLKAYLRVPNTERFKLSQMAKRLRTGLSKFSTTILKEAMEKAGGAASESLQVLSTMNRTASSVKLAGGAAFSIGAIYARTGLRGVKFVGKLLGNTTPGKIVVKGAQKVATAIGNTRVGKFGKKVAGGVKKVVGMPKAYKEFKKRQKDALKNKAKDAITTGARKANQRFARTQAGKLAAKAAGKAKMIANSKAGKVMGGVGKVIAAPFKGMSWVNNKLNLLGKAFKEFIKKAKYAIMSFIAGFLAIYILFMLMFSSLLSIATVGTAADSTIMAPPATNWLGFPVSEEEYNSRWEEFKGIIQDRYQETVTLQQEIMNDVQTEYGKGPKDSWLLGLFNFTSKGWDGQKISEYGYTDTSGNYNDGFWLTYDPYADDNAKDAIVLAYIVMGSENFWNDPIIRDDFIEDLRNQMNPQMKDEDYFETVHPEAVYVDTDKRIYACVTGCSQLTYYCGDTDAVDDFDKEGVDGVTNNFSSVGEKSVEELKNCIRIAADGSEVLYPETPEEIKAKKPNEDEPVIYADELEEHALGDSYTSTCTGAETVKITYSYTYQSSEYTRMSAYEYADYHGYYTYSYFSSSNCNLECPYTGGAHYHFYDRYGDLVDYEGANSMYGYKPVTKTASTTASVTMAQLGISHGSYTPAETGIDNADQVVAPSDYETVTSYEALSYIKNNVKSSAFSVTNIVYPAECEHWTVEFTCTGHTINQCTTGHRDFGATVHQYSIEDYAIFGDASGGSLTLPRDGLYTQYFDEFFESEPDESTLEWAVAMISQDWTVLYGVNPPPVSVVEDGFIDPAYVYNFLMKEGEDYLAVPRTQAAAILGYIKVASDFEINKSSSGFYGLCQWVDNTSGETDELDKVGRNGTDNPPTLLEQLALLREEYKDVALYGGFSSVDKMVEFRECKDTVADVEKAARIMGEEWLLGNIDSADQVVTEAVNFYNQMLDPNSMFNNPNLETICDIVTWALEVAQSNQHGYCQLHNSGSRDRERADYDCSGFVNTAFGTVGLGPVVGYNNAGVSDDALQLGDCLWRNARPNQCGHVEIYIGKNTSVGARSNDGSVSCVEFRINKEQNKVDLGDGLGEMAPAWHDHTFHQAGDQGIGWKYGASYTYDEISAHDIDWSFYDGYNRLF